MFIIIGALISRLHGSTFPTPKAFESLLWAFPFACIASQYVDFYAIITLVLCALGKSTGHGNFMDLGKWNYYKKREDERLEFIIKPLYKKIPEYYYDALGLAVTGFAAVSGFVIVISFINPLWGLIAAIGGMFKACAYMIGHRIGKHQTVIGEILTGAFAFIVLDLIYFDLITSL